MKTLHLHIQGMFIQGCLSQLMNPGKGQNLPEPENVRTCIEKVYSKSYCFVWSPAEGWKN